MNPKTQLCWDCQNARADKCCWFDDFTPVEGWDAEWQEAQLTKHGYNLGATYHIKKCPNFVPDEGIVPVKIGRPSGVNNRIASLFLQLEEIQKKQQKLLRRSSK